MVPAITPPRAAPLADASITPSPPGKTHQFHRGKSGVLVLVGHQANIIDLTRIAPSSGGAVVVRAEAQGNINVAGETPAQQFRWPD